MGVAPLAARVQAFHRSAERMECATPSWRAASVATISLFLQLLQSALARKPGSRETRKIAPGEIDRALAPRRLLGVERPSGVAGNGHDQRRGMRGVVVDRLVGGAHDRCGGLRFVGAEVAVPARMPGARYLEAQAMPAL